MRLDRRELLVLLLLVGLALPFLGKPVHLDDANFLALARGAAADPWRPHAVEINWQGQTEPAFDVLSNPPGIAWLLAPVAAGPVEVQHALVLLWLVLAVPAAARLGTRVGASGPAAALLIVGSPVALWAATALTPDLPLLALTLAGVAGLLGAPPANLARAWPWALLLGAAGLFRYSGIALVPLAALWPLLHGRVRDALLLGLAAAAPLLGLAVHDLLAYGELHLLAMVGFQGVSDTGHDLFRKLAAAVAMLGGAGVLPLLCWARPRPAALGALLGLGLGIAAAAISSHSGVAALATVLACAAGGASLGGTIRLRDRTDAFLLTWLLLGLSFLLTLRFTAARYWLPFLPPAVLLPLRAARPGLLRLAVPATVGLAFLLALDDANLARAQARLAAAVLAETPGETGLFAGHWGFQHHLEAAGWRALEEDSPVPPGALLAVSEVAWPQQPAPGCLEIVSRNEAPDPWPGPRVHTAAGAANLHAFVISASPPVETYAPWTLADDPLDVVTLWRGCER